LVTEKGTHLRGFLLSLEQEIVPANDS